MPSTNSVQRILSAERRSKKRSSSSKKMTERRDQRRVANRDNGKLSKSMRMAMTRHRANSRTRIISTVVQAGRQIMTLTWTTMQRTTFARIVVGRILRNTIMHMAQDCIRSRMPTQNTRDFDKSIPHKRLPYYALCSMKGSISTICSRMTAQWCHQ